MSLDDTRSLIPSRVRYLPAIATIRFEQDNLHYVTSNGAEDTEVHCPAYTSLPIGLRFTLDNSLASGALALVPTSGTPLSIPSGKVYDCVVAADGAIKAGELAAAPT